MLLKYSINNEIKEAKESNNDLEIINKLTEQR